MSIAQAIAAAGLAVVLSGCAQPRNHWSDVSRGVAIVIDKPAK